MRSTSVGQGFTLPERARGQAECLSYATMELDVK